MSSQAARPVRLERSQVRPVRNRLLRDVSVGLLAALAATALRALLGPAVGTALPFITYFPAVAVAASAGGLVGGLVTTAVAAVVSAQFLLEPAGARAPSELVPLALFVGGAVLIAALGENLHEARRRAEDAEAGARFLADASAALAATFQPAGTLDVIGRLVVPRFADGCLVDVLDDAGEFAELRVVGAEPAAAPAAAGALADVPVRASDPGGVARVVRTGEAAYAPDARRPQATSDDPRLRQAVEQLGVRSAITVPLAAGGRRLGALTVFMSSSGRRFLEADVAVAQELAGRAAVALQHARLFGRVQARSEELDAVLGTIDDAVLVVDGSGAIRSHNAAAERVLGRELPATGDEAMALLAPISESTDTFVIPATHRYVRPSSVEVETGEGRLQVVVLRDVTELLESQAARDAFLGMLSHELRTPITTIFGAANVLRRPVAEEVRHELIRDVLAESDRLYRLVEDLLVLSRFERGRLEAALEPVLLQRILPRLARLEEQRWPGIEVRVEVARGLPAVLADPTYVEQVVRNLLSNAAKYGGSAAPIMLRVTEDPGDACVRLSIEDGGPGVPPGEEERIFKLYERLPDASRSLTPGAGIGLFVCRRLVEMMGGQIGVERADGGGARFWFSLPIDRSADEREADRST